MRPPGRPPAWRRLALLPVVSLALVLAGAATSGASTTSTSSPADPWVAGMGGTLTLGIDQAPNGCNPNTATGDTAADQLVLTPVLPSAFVTSAVGASVYDSAVITQAELVSTNPQTVVYTIDPKAVWSNGTPITANDFIYAWEQQRGPVPAIPGAGAPSDSVATTLGYDDIKSVTGSNGGRTVTVVFSTPFADWKMLFHDLLPANVLQRTGWAPACATVDPAVDLSGGPFELASVSSSRIVLVRNPKWWGQTPDLDRIVIRIARNDAQLASWLTSGRVQVVEPDQVDQQFLQDVTSHPTVVSAEGASSTFVQLEFSTTGAITGDLRVREAIAHAIDRQSLVEQVVGSVDTTIVPAASHLYAQGQTSYPSPVPPPVQVAAQPGYTAPTVPSSPTAADPFPLTADPDQTTSLLIEAGYNLGPGGQWVQPDGKPLVLDMVVDADDGWTVQAASVISRQLEADGIAVDETTAPSAAAAGMVLAGGQADMAVIPTEATPYPSEALAWYTQVLGPAGQNGSQDYSNYDDPTLTNQLVKASEELNPVTAAPMYTQADLMLWKAMVALPLFTEPVALAWSSYTTGEGLSIDAADLLWEPNSWALRVPPTSTKTAPG